MGLAEWFGTDRSDAPVVRKSEGIDAQCCGHGDFVVGGVLYGFAFDGHRVIRTEGGALICCTHCGRRYGVNEHGLYDAHPDALPVPWAVAEHRKKDAERAGSNGAGPPRRAPVYRRPPAVPE